MQQSRLENRFFFLFFFCVTAATCFFIRNYLMLIATSFLVALVCRPLYRTFLRWTGKRQWAALILLYTVVILVILLPLIAVGAMIWNIIKDFTSGAGTSYLASGLSLPWLVNHLNTLLSSIPGVSYQLTSDQVNNQLQAASTLINSRLFSGLRGFGTGLLQLIPTLFIGFAVFNAVITHYSKIRAFALKLSPLDDSIDSLYIDRIKAMSLSMVRGTFIIALIQGTLTGLLLWIAGVKYAAFLGLLATIASIIPLGAGVISLPIGVGLILTGNVWQGLLQIVGNLLVVCNIDNILRPRLVSKEANLHPVLVLIGLFAGLGTFGFLGAIYGPVIMIVFVTTVEVYLSYFQTKEMNHSSHSGENR